MRSLQGQCPPYGGVLLLGVSVFLVLMLGEALLVAVHPCVWSAGTVSFKAPVACCCGLHAE